MNMHTHHITRRKFLGSAATGAGMLAMPRLFAAEAELSERQKVEAAIPTKAFATPRKPRKLLIFGLNVNYGGHPSIPTANLAFELMGRKTGAFETVVSRDPVVFQPESLRQFDAVFFNNNVGNLFEDPALRQSLVEFVYAGGGMMGVHGTSVAFTRWPGAKEDWPEFGVMIGGRGANHRVNTEHVFIKLDDPEHPLNQPFGGKGFEYRSEFFRVHEPYSRDRLRVLFSIDTAKTDLTEGGKRTRMERADNDYALAWARNYGRGRTFYCTIAHNPSIFWDATMLRFYLAAAQFVLGDLPCPTIPSGKLTPAIRAQEKLGWRLGVEAGTFQKSTMFEAIEKTAQLGVLFMGGMDSQKVSQEIPKNFDPQLTDDEQRQIRLKLDAAGVRLLTYYIHKIPGDEAGCRRVFEFARKIGVETIMSAPAPETLDMIEKFADAFDINVAIHNLDQKDTPRYWQPEGVLKACAARSKRIGACGDLGCWLRCGIDSMQALQTLGERLITVHMHDVSERSLAGRDVPWGSGDGKIGGVLHEMRRLGIRPTMFGIEYPCGGPDSLPEIARCVEFFNGESLKIK
ncbi:MAG: ThuA domain-containing protein [Verrucomicrobia bacterium]|nr:ThuA domain-containing protein [Verrucomicrobiota bacterium]